MLCSTEKSVHRTTCNKRALNGTYTRISSPITLYSLQRSPSTLQSTIPKEKLPSKTKRKRTVLETLADDRRQADMRKDTLNFIDVNVDHRHPQYRSYYLHHPLFTPFSFASSHIFFFKSSLFKSLRVPYHLIADSECLQTPLQTVSVFIRLLAVGEKQISTRCMHTCIHIQTYTHIPTYIQSFDRCVN